MVFLVIKCNRESFRYLGVFGDRTRPLLSGGLPYSFSFWLRYTPGCGSQFDLARSRWVQASCPIPYYQLETIIAVLNIALAIGCIAFTLSLIFAIRKERTAAKTSLPAAYSQLSRGKLPDAPSSINDLSSGYMNSSYEEVNEIVHTTPSPREAPRPAPRLADKKKKKNGKPRPQSMPQPDVYSSAETEEIRKEDFYTKPQKLKKTAAGGGGGGRFKKQQDQQRRPPALEERKTSRSSTINTTSLVSFDPKSGTLLRVREHFDSDEDYGRHEAAIDCGSIYERIRPREEPVPNPRLSASTKSKNASQDSVPSTLAPVLVSPTVDGSSCDSGVPSSSCAGEQWPAERPPPVDISHITSPGIRLSQPEYVLSPGIRLSSAIAMERQRRSSFHVQNQESRRIIGHYHSVNEFALTDSEDSTPVINGRSLLV